jgi:indoleamine 2,3-dioxygenase
MAELLSKLAQYDVSKFTGFLPEQQPLRRLPSAYHEPWEIEAAALPESIRHDILRQRVAAMPVLSAKMLTTEEE